MIVWAVFAVIFRAGFKRRHICEIIAPALPLRAVREAEERGCFPCAAPRSCILHEAGSLQQTTQVISRYYGSRHNIPRRITCSTRNVIYYILCDCRHPTDYVGSTVDMKRRWSKHKWDIRNEKWTACGLTSHFGQHHMGDRELAISNLKVTLVDTVKEEKELKRREDKWMYALGTIFVGANSRNEILSNRRINYGGGVHIPI